MKDIFAEIDAIVMLTTSDWKTEPRSNRYHYASRFSKILPVIFIQPDFRLEKFHFEKTSLENLEILHVYQKFGVKQSSLINEALNAKGIVAPLIWVYNPYFVHFIATRYTPMMVYHATENHLCDDFPNNPFLDQGSFPEQALHQVTESVDLIIAVSNSVAKDLIEEFACKEKVIVLKNCCDLEFYDYLKHKKNIEKSEKIRIIYQGTLFDKLDYQLLNQLVCDMPDVEFVFCGRLIGKIKQQKILFKHKNVKYLGELSIERLREEMYACSLGIIPYQPFEFVKKSHPLKAYEYLAVDIPVVSVPIDSLEADCKKGAIYFATTAKEYKEKIAKALSETRDTISIKNRRDIVECNNYDFNFNKLKYELSSSSSMPAKKKLNILVLYELHSCYVSTIKEHIDAFGWYSSHNIHYAPASQNKCAYDLSAFDVIILHYSLRLIIRVGACTISEDYESRIKSYGGYKVLFLQDEYENTDLCKARMRELGVNMVYTCVPIKEVPKVYFDDEFPNVTFVHNLTGYVSPDMGIAKYSKPLKERKNLIGYRGRNLPYYYGKLGHEKYDIGIVVKDICDRKGLFTDIEVTEEKRIYGDGWYEFLANSRATLGTESGSNIFDFTGELKEKHLKSIAKKPNLKFESVYNKYYKKFDNFIHMNQISPKIFEAISLRVALVLFEGEYSGVVKPHTHYIPLKKDFSNIDEVLLKLQDDTFVEQLTDRAYQDVILSGDYLYKTFIQSVDRELSKRVCKRNAINIISGPLYFSSDLMLVEGSSSYVDMFAYNVISRDFIGNGKKHRLDMQIEEMRYPASYMASIYKRILSRSRSLSRFRHICFNVVLHRLLYTYPDKIISKILTKVFNRHH